MNDLSKESNKKKFNNHNYIYLDDEEYSESSLDQKIKKLQEKTFGKEKNENLEDYTYYNDNNYTNKKYNISNSGSNNSIFNSNKNLKSNKLSKTKKSKSSSKINYININKRNLKYSSTKKNNNIKTKTTQKQNTSIRSNGNNKNYLYSELDFKNNEFYYGNDYDIKKYKNEIIHLKNTINRLRIENDKLKKSLQNERKQNKKFRQLTEEIIKHYEKTK